MNSNFLDELVDSKIWVDKLVFFWTDFVSMKGLVHQKIWYLKI